MKSAADSETTEEKRPTHAALKAFLRLLGFLISIAAVLLGVVDVVRAINPSVFVGHGPVVAFFSNLYPVIPALILGVVGFILGFGSKILSGRARRSGLTTAAILLSILGIVLSGTAFITTHIFPEGMIHPTTQSSAPLNNSEELSERIDWAFGSCDSGWATIDPARFPGVSYINVCSSNSTMFVAYDSPKEADAYSGIMAGKAADYIQSSLGQKLTPNTYYSLSGDQWLVVGHKKGIKKLQSLWGGRRDPVEPPSKQVTPGM